MGPDFLPALEAGVQRAEDALREGRFRAALGMYREILAGRLAASLEPTSRLMAADLVVTDRLVDLAILFGDLEAADALLHGMVVLCHEAGNTCAADYARVKRVQVALARGALRHAQQQLDELSPNLRDLALPITPSALAVWERRNAWPGAGAADQAVLFAAFHLAVGRLLAANGRYGDAMAFLERGLAHASESAPQAARQAWRALELASCGALLERGDLAAAAARLALVERGLDERQDPGGVVRWLELRAKIDMLRGELGAAVRCYERVAQICTRYGFALGELTARMNLAQVMILLNRTRAASELLLEAQRAAERLSDVVGAARAGFLLDLARLRGQSLADGMPLAGSVSAMWAREEAKPPTGEPGPLATHGASTPLDLPQSTSFLAFFEERALAFNWHLSRWELAAASRVLVEKRRVFELSDSKLIHLRLRVMAAVLDYYDMELTTAAAELPALCDELEASGLVPDLWQAKRVLGWCHARLGLPTAEREGIATAAEALLARMADSLSGSDRAMFLLNKWTAEEEFIASEVDALIAARRAAASRRFGRWRPQGWSWMRRLNGLINHIKDYHRGLAEGVAGSGAAAAGNDERLSLLRRLLRQPAHRATVLFVQLPDRLLTITIRRWRLDFGVTPISRVQLRELVRQWHEIMPSAAGARDLITVQKHMTKMGERSDQVAARIADALQLPAILAALPRRVCALAVVPDDCLHGIPFAALRLDGHPLVARYAISIGFGAGDHRRRPAIGRRLEALLVAVSTGTRALAALPNTRREIDQVEAWFAHRKLQILRACDEGASKAVVLAALERCAGSHIACHGTFQPDRPDESGLLLVPSAEQPELLSLRELARLDLRGLRHITLSSCWSADNFVLPGRRIIGLPETLWRAGAESILASLWPVNDAQAVAFMNRFYDYLEREDRDRALQLTQMDCIGSRLSTTRSVTHPFFWAGFTLHGESSRW